MGHYTRCYCRLEPALQAPCRRIACVPPSPTIHPTLPENLEKSCMVEMKTNLTLGMTFSEIVIPNVRFVFISTIQLFSFVVMMFQMLTEQCCCCAKESTLLLLVFSVPYFGYGSNDLKQCLLRCISINIDSG